MRIRNPAVAGSFYPFSARELKQQIDDLLSKAKSRKTDITALVCPHAGYDYSGKTAAEAYNIVKDFYDTVVVLGPNHTGMGNGIATLLADWKTPLGLVKVDEEFVNELTKDSLIAEDHLAHLQEHSIEVQLPFLQTVLSDFKFVPISINPIYYEIDSCKQIAAKLKETAEKLSRKCLFIASSDFTHYGRLYGYTPFQGSRNQILKQIKELDFEFINYIEKIMAEHILEVYQEKKPTICGLGAIASLLFLAKLLKIKQASLVDYSTSYDVSRNFDSIVAYASLKY